eukprot:TRINITY_DN10789_c0_g1_i1.p1 TRINITY_DN10789_c0_g1~~TRINITY_DN10789_c0_g1_i1.p1  ORF type:complete len:242 (+),score=10.37 TRINITY_DN10789_c0_g1_i1:49-774(+)
MIERRQGVAPLQRSRQTNPEIQSGLIAVERSRNQGLLELGAQPVHQGLVRRHSFAYVTEEHAARAPEALALHNAVVQDVCEPWSALRMNRNSTHLDEKERERERERERKKDTFLHFLFPAMPPDVSFVQAAAGREEQTCCQPEARGMHAFVREEQHGFQPEARGTRAFVRENQHGFQPHSRRTRAFGRAQRAATRTCGATEVKDGDLDSLLSYASIALVTMCISLPNICSSSPNLGRADVN